MTNFYGIEHFLWTELFLYNLYVKQKVVL